MKSGSPPGSSCSRRRRSSRGAATSWRGGGRSCRGSGSTRTYRFETDEGSASLADLFRGRSQLLVYHFMFGPDYTAGCPSCSAIADGFNGFVVHLANHDVTLSAVSRAPLAKLQAYKRRMGWTFPWASSLGSDFNFDFNVSFTEEQQREGTVEYNYRREAAVRRTRSRMRPPRGRAEFAAMTGTDVATYTRERPGMSAFALEDGVVYHTYSAYARGLDGLWGMYQWLDRAPRGRNETGLWFRRTTSTTRVERSGGCRGDARSPCASAGEVLVSCRSTKGSHDRTTSRPASRHPRSPDPQGRVARTHARVVDLRADSPGIEGSAAYPAGVALSRPSPARAARLDHRQLGQLREQPQGEILRAHARRPEAAGLRRRRLGPADGRRRFVLDMN